MIKRVRNKLNWEIKKARKSCYQYYEKVFKKIIPYKPKFKSDPKYKLDVEVTAWRGLEQIIEDIIQQSGIERKKCLEFGVEFGFSTVAFSNYFEEVVGVDIFTGDPHAGFHGDIFPKVNRDLAQYKNITLIKSDYKEYIKNNENQFDLIHVDIIHTYEATYDCGIWSALHSRCTLFHDTESFPEVKRAVLDISRKTGKTFYNYPYSDGLGILF